MWAPDVYEGAPTTTTTLMAAAVKTAAFGAMLRILLVGLGPLAAEWQSVLAILAVLTMIGGNLGALAQSNLKRMLAYSSIAHAGYMLTALVAAPRVAAEAVAFYLVGYAAVSVGAFGALAALAREGREPATLADVAGLGARRPALAAAITLFMISLTGVPVSAGFVGKFQLFRAAIAGGWTVLALVGVLMSVVSAYYYLRVVVAMYMRAPEGEDGWSPVAAPAGLALGAAALTVLWLGVLPASALSWARAAAIALLP
jgi:NADH-quinone oxidoreductase subunit N